MAQININPDPNEKPWIAGGVPEMTPEIINEIELLPEFQINPEVLTIPLPVDVDNSLRSYMTDIFRQNGNSCSQAAAVGYMFTYEINRQRNIPSDNDSTRYHPSFTYNFLNYSSPDSGTYIHDGLRILKEMGCPSITTYGRSIGEADPKEWISGYDKYFKAMQNRIISYEKIDMPSDSGLFDLKHWLYDHNSEDTIGGLVVFAVKNMGGCDIQIIQDGPEMGKSIIISCKTTSEWDAHALTIVGYDDNISYDINANNIIEENELGAFKIANSWDVVWPTESDGGFCYILYSLFSDDSVFLNGNYGYICHAVADYDPEITIKAKMTHPYRKGFSQQLGSDTIAGELTPSSVKSIFGYFKSGDFSLSLTGMEPPDDTLDWLVDYSYLLYNDPTKNLGKLFYRPRTSMNFQDDGMLWYGSMVDHRWGETFELPLSNIPDTMEYTQQWKFSVNYDLLPFSIDVDTLLVTNQIFRLSDTLSEGATLTIGSGHSNTELHLHDAELLIEEGSVLYLSAYSSLIAKSGTNKIIVKGSLIIEPNAYLKSEGNATLEIYFESDTINSNYSNCTIENVKITGYSHALTINECHLSGLQVHYSSGNLVFSDNTCFNSVLKAYHPLNSSSFCSITNNSFDNNNNTPGWSVITIEDYPSFLIQDNSIQYNYDRGVELFYAGMEARGVHSLENNTIQFTGFPMDSVAELGIHAYYSNVDIHNNKIQYNDYGITGFHRSELTVLGDSLAEDFDETQLIGDNTKSQCLFNLSTFPTVFHWNVVRDVSSQDRPFIKVVEFDEMIEDTNEVRDWSGDHDFDVTYNCWVNDTNPDDRLVPNGAYLWRPAWCPGSGHLFQEEEPKLLYEQAMAEITEGDYTEAESGFKQIISVYPEDKYAQASLKELFALNPAIYDTNYMIFMTYCDSLSINPGDSLLGTTADWLSIHCKIKDKQYQSAINELDSVLSNAGTVADSVFAMIDLNYVYLNALDSNNLQSRCISKNDNMLARTSDGYSKKRKDWIELLMKDTEVEHGDQTEPINDQSISQTSQNISIYPNPASENINIISNKPINEIFIYNTIGGQVFFSDNAVKQMIIDVGSLPAGLYFVQCRIDGAIITRKIVVLP
jgi:hypothetical protein